MSEIKAGDIVARVSHGRDVLFKITKFFTKRGHDMATLRGLDIRLEADAPLPDLVKIPREEVSAYWKKVMTKGGEQVRRCFERREKEQIKNRPNDKAEPFDVPGKVLHIDGDEDYFDLCMSTYKQLGVPAEGYNIPEKDQPQRVQELLQKHMPDILVLTGHDGFKKGKKDFRDINNYRNSKYFIEAVKNARRYEKNRDDLVIFAGACQSYYEALLEAGANFASAPERVLIHAFDPVFVAEKVSYTPVYRQVPLREILEGTITGYPGVGGIDTLGKYRMGVPKSNY
ncbi:MAG: sporulation peptidase YabG [Peptococcaceae bacterium]|nr:sporulation peptidase YabG [Peptococcaceae bacterium]